MKCIRGALMGIVDKKYSCLPISQDSNQRRKMCCILYYTRCDSKDIHKNKLPHSCLGRITTKFCYRCKVVLCVQCYDVFHMEKDLSLSPYVLTKLGVKQDGTKRGLSRDCNTRKSSPKRNWFLRRLRR